jgi:hypothetical protein
MTVEAKYNPLKILRKTWNDEYASCNGKLIAKVSPFKGSWFIPLYPLKGDPARVDPP